jgi:hypothetical protein
MARLLLLFSLLFVWICCYAVHMGPLYSCPHGFVVLLATWVSFLLSTSVCCSTVPMGTLICSPHRSVVLLSAWVRWSALHMGLLFYCAHESTDLLSTWVCCSSVYRFSNGLAVIFRWKLIWNFRVSRSYWSRSLLPYLRENGHKIGSWEQNPEFPAGLVN